MANGSRVPAEHNDSEEAMRWGQSRKTLFVMPYGLRLRKDRTDALAGMWEFPVRWEWSNNLSLVQVDNSVELRRAARINRI